MAKKLDISQLEVSEDLVNKVLSDSAVNNLKKKAAIVESTIKKLNKVGPESTKGIKALSKVTDEIEKLEEAGGLGIRRLSQSIEGISNPKQIKKFSKNVQKLSKISDDIKSVNDSSGKGLEQLSGNVENISDPKKIKRFKKGVKSLSKISDDIKVVSDSSGEGIDRLSENIDELSDLKKIKRFKKGVVGITKMSSDIVSLNNLSNSITSTSNLSEQLENFSNVDAGKFQNTVNAISKVTVPENINKVKTGSASDVLGDALQVEEEQRERAMINKTEGVMKETKQNQVLLRQIRDRLQQPDTGTSTVGMPVTGIPTPSTAGSGMGLLGGLAGMLGGLFNGPLLLKMASRIGASVLKAVGKSLGTILRTAVRPFTALGETLLKKMSTVKEFLSTKLGTVKKFLSGKIRGVFNDLTAGFSNLKTKLKNLPGQLKNKVKNLFPKSVRDKAGQVVDKVKSTAAKVKSGVTKIKAAVTEGVDKVKGVAKEGIDKVKSTASRLKSGAKKVITKPVELVKNFFTETKVPKPTAKPKGLLSRAWSGVKNTAGKVKGAVTGLFDKVNPGKLIKKNAKKIFPKLGKFMKGVAKRLPGIGPLIAMVELGLAGKDAYDILSKGGSMRDVAIAMIPRAGGVLGSLIGGAIGTAALPIPILGTLVGALGGDFIGRGLAGHFAPEIATALGFTEANNSKKLAEFNKAAGKEGVIKNPVPTQQNTNSPEEIAKQMNEKYEGSDSQLVTKFDAASNVRNATSGATIHKDDSSLLETMNKKIDSLAELVVGTATPPTIQTSFQTASTGGSGQSLYKQ